MSFYLDSNGFIRRECPNCEREFKWYWGKTDSTPEGWVDPPVYSCPLCGRTAGHDSWWTPAQLEYAAGATAGPVQDMVADELRNATKELGGGVLSFEVTTPNRPSEPDPIVEPDDMVIVEPPCHPWEPLKVPDDGRSNFYCLVCGEEFAA